VNRCNAAHAIANSFAKQWDHYLRCFGMDSPDAIANALLGPPIDSHVSRAYT
jgi:hypothetical protein